MDVFQQVQTLAATQDFRQELRLITLIQQAEILGMAEDKLDVLVREVEHSSLFRRLHERERVIRYQRFPRTTASRRSVEAALAAAPGYFEPETLLASRREVLPLMRILGADRFKKLFLCAEEGMGTAELAVASGLSSVEVERINRFVDDFAAASEFYNPSALQNGDIRYFKVAAIEAGAGGFTIAFCSPRYARGAVLVDSSRLAELEASGAFSPGEQRELPGLVRCLEMINNRRNTVYRILVAVLARQAPFFSSGDSRALLPLSQKEIAASLGIPASNVCRAIAARSIDTPWGEKPLKEFFLSPKSFRKGLVARVIAEAPGRLPDEALRGRLRDRFGVALSRRGVATLRVELGMPSSRGCKQHGCNLH